jgi:hypothetical protein
MEDKGFIFEQSMPKIQEGEMIKEEWTRLFIKKEYLGGGRYGRVYLATTLDGKKEIVVKFIDLENLAIKEKEYCEEEPKNLRIY